MNARYLVCLLITLASGAAALTHELLWTRRLVDILGATGEATSIVLGCFFFGLSVGAAWASRWVDQLSNAWRALAIVEVAIALLTIPAAILPFLTDWIWPTLGPDLLISWPGHFVKFLISVLVVVPPATAMGMTLPILVVAIEKSVTDNRTSKIVIYAFNTMGGACGLLVTSIWLLGACGVLGSMLIAIILNLLVASSAWSMQTSRLCKPRRKRKTDVPLPDDRDLLGKRTCIGIAAFSGFSVLGLEVVAIRLLALVVPSSFQATGCVLLSAILLLGIAALVAPLLKIVLASYRWQLAIVLSISAVGSAMAPWLLHNRTSQLVSLPTLAAMEGRAFQGAIDFQISVVSTAMMTVGLSLFFAGLVFPLVFAATPQDSCSSTGRSWAVLLAVNGVGGIVGAMLAEYLLLPTFGIYGGMVAMGIIQALAAFVFAMSLAEWKQLVPSFVAFAICACLIPVALGLPYITPRSKRQFEVEDIRFGKDGVCLVTKTEEKDRGILMNNQYVLGSTNAYQAQRRQVFIPLLLHGDQSTADNRESAKQVCCLGLATGMSAGAAIDFDDSCLVTAIELSPMVVAAARDHFEQENKGVVTSQRATIIVEDARTYISSVRDKYDVIAGDLYRPYGAGEGRLFSVEHFRNVRRALRKGGIYCQWIPAYQITEQHFDIIAATFLQAFPNAALLRVDSESEYPQLGLMGSNDAEISWAAVEARCRQLESRGLGDSRIQDLDFVRSTFVGRLSTGYFESKPINTLNNARLEIMAGLHRVTLDPRLPKGRPDKDAYLQGENWNRFSKKLKKLTVSSLD